MFDLSAGLEMVVRVFSFELVVRIPSSLSVASLGLPTGFTTLAPLRFSFPLLGILGMRVIVMACRLVVEVGWGTWDLI